MKECSRPDLESSLAGECEDARAVRIYNALAHGVRLRILRQLLARDACCFKDIVSTIDLAQSTVSQHLKVLVEAGLVDYRPERQSSRYSVNPQALAAIRSHLNDLADYKQVQEKCDAVFRPDLRQNNADQRKKPQNHVE